MSFAHFLHAQAAPILDEWERFARAEIAPARELSRQALRDDANDLLVEIRRDLASAARNAHLHRLVVVENPEVGAANRAAHRHAQSRFAQGFALTDLVLEYCALREIVVTRWRSAQPDGADDVIGFNRALDLSLSDAIGWYSATARRARGLLMGVLGHDLRTPLSTLDASAQTLLLFPEATDRQKDVAARMHRSAQHMGRLIEDLLDFTRTTLGTRLPISRARCDLATLAGEVAEELGAIYGDRARTRLPGGPVVGEWDAARLRQLILNIAHNALLHARGDTEATIAVRDAGERAVVEVHNWGDPIDPDVFQAIFEPLVTDAAQKERKTASGLGLGLYISREIAVAHGGAIEVSSTREQGTTFAVSLPKSGHP